MEETHRIQKCMQKMFAFLSLHPGSWFLPLFSDVELLLLSMCLQLEKQIFDFLFF